MLITNQKKADFISIPPFMTVKTLKQKCLYSHREKNPTLFDYLFLFDTGFIEDLCFH
jgi:hypothetical protein